MLTEKRKVLDIRRRYELVGFTSERYRFSEEHGHSARHQEEEPQGRLGAQLLLEDDGRKKDCHKDAQLVYRYDNAGRTVLELSLIHI